MKAAGKVNSGSFFFDADWSSFVGRSQVNLSTSQRPQDLTALISTRTSQRQINNIL